MKKIYILILLCLGLCGCASYQWTHYPAKSEEEFNRDSYDCQNIATEKVYSRDLGNNPNNQFNPLYKALAYEDCLKQKYGYYQQAVK